MASGKKQGRYLGADDNALHGKGGHVERLAKRVVQLESHLAAAQRDRDGLREALEAQGRATKLLRDSLANPDMPVLRDKAITAADTACQLRRIALARQQGADGERVDAHRHKRQQMEVTLHELAQRSGLSVPDVSSAEHGRAPQHLEACERALADIEHERIQREADRWASEGPDMAEEGDK